MPSKPASRPASSKRSKQSKPKQSKTPRQLPSPRELTKMFTNSYNASPLRTFPIKPIKLLTFNASPLSPTKRRHSRAAKKMQDFFRGHMVRKMTKKIQNAAKICLQ